MKLSALAALALAALPLHAQMTMDHDGPLPKQPAQAAYASIAEIVRILKADSTTDWSKVDLEAVRQHMIDMDAVTMRAQVKQQSVPGGVSMMVTGDAVVAASIKRMLTSHAGMLDQDPQYHAVVVPLASGVRFTVTAKDPANAKVVALIRGLGFAGLLTEGDHHARHHLALARGDAMAHMH
ncbi:MAG TPA: hypothetical protein VGQ30_13000 [Gemmatimonadaceae bacterium]|nr:hypothetical protein [Gemmatimonadaceae bacterium]